MDNDTTAEGEWKVSRVAIDPAMSNIGAHSAKGLDEIPPGLVKRLGQNARETLASIFTGIIHGDPIPEDWRRGKVAPKCQLSSKQQILWSLQELLLSQNSHKVSPTTELGYHKQVLHREEALFHCEEVAEQDVL
ncbi:hypothetical protein HPB52_002785 [Rhipicephalus sanguineus]|uniref:Uncharacterized protein n=1 Tax=Rhipicephalus sanguineus TaxID=34632 RepID=A0A9D4Q9A1_RHISA|nr:hypothetical protein HPB52_002785 [Rhipicephalus sanguineus]